MNTAQLREQVIRAQTIAGIHTDAYVGNHQERRWRGGESFRLAAAFDPIRETTEHCAALLYFLGFGDGKWLYCAGVSMDVVLLVEEVSLAFEGEFGPDPRGCSASGVGTGTKLKDGGSAAEDAWWQLRAKFFEDYLARVVRDRSAKR